MNRRTFSLAASASTLALALLFSSGVAAQNKMQRCGQIEISVDINKSVGNWNNSAYVLKLQGTGEGWTIFDPEDQRGQNIKATPGMKLRFNVNDGANRPINVTPSSAAGKSLNVRSGSRPAIILVDVRSSQAKTGAVRFNIDGADKAATKINGCPGGSFYLDLE